MQKQGLKLHQASAVLQIQPKELLNLVRFGVVKPQRSEGTYVFDANTTGSQGRILPERVPRHTHERVVQADECLPGN